METHLFLLLVPLRLAGSAEPSQLDIDGIYCPHGLHVTATPEVIPFLVIEISHESTLGADKMVMAVGVCIKTRFVTEKSHARDESLLFEQVKCPVHGIK